MIKLFRDGDTSIWMHFDAAGLDRLIEIFQKVISSKEAGFNADFDMSVVTKKRKSKALNLFVSVSLGDETQLLRSGENISWTLDNEDIEEAVALLTKCKKAGEFNPAEFLCVQTPKNKNVDHIYCEFLSQGTVNES